MAGPTGLNGPTGPTGPAGTVDYSRAIANGTGAQPNASFNISGSGTIAGDLTAGRVVPNFDSGWFAVTNTSGEVAIQHGLGSVPSQVMLHQCGALIGNDCATRTVIAGTRGYQDGVSFVNPVTITADGAQLFLSLDSASWVWGYYNPASGWLCTDDADNDCFTGYYRVLAWR